MWALTGWCTVLEWLLSRSVPRRGLRLQLNGIRSNSFKMHSLSSVSALCCLLTDGGRGSFSDQDVAVVFGVGQGSDLWGSVTVTSRVVASVRQPGFAGCVVVGGKDGALLTWPD